MSLAVQHLLLTGAKSRPIGEKRFRSLPRALQVRLALLAAELLVGDSRIRPLIDGSEVEVTFFRFIDEAISNRPSFPGDNLPLVDYTRSIYTPM